jgi:hypothetical protein
VRFAAAIFYSRVSKALGTAQFLMPFFNSGYYSHVISASVIAICKSLSVKAIKIALGHYATLLLETSVLYDYFPNFIAQLPSAPPKIAFGIPTLVLHTTE